MRHLVFHEDTQKYEYVYAPEGTTPQGRKLEDLTSVSLDGVDDLEEEMDNTDNTYEYEGETESLEEVRDGLEELSGEQ